MPDNISGATYSTEEITTLNGGSVSSQHIQRVTVAGRISDGTAVDLIGAKTIAQSLPVNIASDQTVNVAASSVGFGYEAVPVSQIDQILGSTGAAGDMLEELWVYPTGTTVGAVLLKDGGTTIVNYPGGTVGAGLYPFQISPPVKSVGALSVTTPANARGVAVGKFT